MTAKLLLGGVLAVALACGGSNPGAAAAGSIEDRDWNLVALGDKADPVGAGGQPITLRLDADKKRAAGFGGCNRYSGGYERDGEHLKFGAVASTRMACQQDMDVEELYLPTLGAVETWLLDGDVLVLKAAGVAVLRFRAAP